MLGQRALAGRACTSAAAVDAALQAGVAEWNQHPTPFLWGRPPKPKRQLKCAYIYYLSHVRNDACSTFNYVLGMYTRGKEVDRRPLEIAALSPEAVRRWMNCIAAHAWRC